ncbi:MAG: hypothetical protein LBD70_02865, partial [Bifidobacteriaceae bacterium]|nr:hypothetical protein [Bifidobacteriaceae bacterium]
AVDPSALGRLRADILSPDPARQERATLIRAAADLADARPEAMVLWYPRHEVNLPLDLCGEALWVRSLSRTTTLEYKAVNPCPVYTSLRLGEADYGRGAARTAPAWRRQAVPPGQPVPPAQPVFAKLDPAVVAAENARLAADQPGD